MLKRDPNDAVTLAPKRAVVTGAAGFIGRHITQHLARQGCHVSGIGHSEMSDEDRKILSLEKWYPGGISASSLAAASDGADVIFHCAGSGSVPLSLQRPMVDFNRNVVSTAEVLNFSRENGKIPVVFLSSAGIYGRTHDMPIQVTTASNPISPYGINKRMGETLVQQYATYFDVPCVIVRLFSVYGNGLRKQLLWDASHKLNRGELSFFGTGEETRDWIHVEDAAELIVQLWSGASTEVPILNGATGEKVAIRRIIQRLASCYGVTDPISFNGEVRPGDPRDYVADVTASLATGWTPRVSLEDGLARYATWFQTNVLPQLQQDQS
ncbi:NAD-dependent epimerase/dehydratase family protein [Marinovum sp. 2_MG-2023]|uniref:NAD-dependent epimerase/dehydratase family protein n=1 Tax=unclassified Marinovum TaxID=2647166 RepID=UPI0026E141BD|nr:MULTISPECIES: NAD-dependent epimerase/dehydratase family protein [unclassified Marinovum]MDO6732147.1 NAD-dependent epimerase/dehydratase family protein [Marinovum sp. 2_MG-2023]MDO6781463.1 NAD-dependent epimerase/dehydratase family protein [Marinovum sp. 1_MG-2023]